LNMDSCLLLTSLGVYAFIDNSIASLNLSLCPSLTTIERYAFYGNSIDTLDLSACTQLVMIGWRAFAYNDFSEFSLPEPHVEGQTFVAWYDYADDVYESGTKVDVQNGYIAHFEDYIITFNISDDDGPIAGAIVTINGSSYISDSNGDVVLDYLSEASYSYTISAEGYFEYEGLLTVTDEGEAIDIVLLKDDDTAIDDLLEKTEDVQLSLYPNPARSELTIANIKVGDLLTLYNASGVKVFQQEVSAAKISINLSGYSRGLYLLSVGTETKRLMLK